MFDEKRRCDTRGQLELRSHRTVTLDSRPERDDNQLQAVKVTPREFDMVEAHLMKTWIRERMKVHRMSNVEVARILGVSAQAVVNWRAGRSLPRAKMFDRLVALLQRSPEGGRHGVDQDL